MPAPPPITWLQADVFGLLAAHPEFVGAFDAVVDVQVYHALRSEACDAELVSVLWALLKPGGVVVLVTGNASPPDPAAGRTVELTVGPTRLSLRDIACSFEGHGFAVEVAQESRFDPTPTYVGPDGGCLPPLAWAVTLRKCER